MKIYKILNHVCLITCIMLCVQTIQLFGQDNNSIIFPGPKKTIIIAGSAFPNLYTQRKLLSNNQQIVVERADGGRNNFKKIGVLQFPNSAAELAAKLGTMQNDVLNQLKVQTIEQAYTILKERGGDTLKLLMIHTEIQEALGITFIDHTRDPLVASTYKLSLQSNDQNIETKTYEVNAGLPTYSNKFEIKKVNSSDSSVTVSWFSSDISNPSNYPLLAKLYKQSTTNGSFEETQKYFVAFSNTGDSLIVNHSESTNPGQKIGYYIQLEDIAGNLGVSSDTAYAITVSRAKIKPILNLKAKDSLGKVLLTWDALPNEAIYAGIQILKSRKVQSDYVVIDTIPINENSYLDENVIQASSYFYRLRPIVLNLNNFDPFSFAETSFVTGVKDSIAPVPPRELIVQQTNEGVKLNWQEPEELNLFGYYVLRGTSLKDMAVISQPVQATNYIDTALIPGYSGQLHYAIQAISLNQQVSDTSEIASVSIRQPVSLMPPAGLSSRWSDIGVSLQWEDAMRRDDNVEGYIIYRKSKSDVKFKRVNQEMLKVPFYKDTLASVDSSYTYVVTSTDSWANQSIFSNSSDVSAELTQTIVLPNELYLRNLRAGIEVFWPESTFKDSEKYVIYRKVSGQSSFQKLATISPSTPYIDQQVQPNQLYEYSIKVMTTNGEGVISRNATIRRN